MWQFMPHGNYGLDAQQLCRRALRSGKIDPRLRPLHEVHLLRSSATGISPWPATTGAPATFSAPSRKPDMPTSGNSTSATTFPAKPRTTFPKSSPPSSSPITPRNTASTTSPSIRRSSPTPSPSTTPPTCAWSPTLLALPSTSSSRSIPACCASSLRPTPQFDLHLPAGTAALFQEKIAAIPESKRNSWRYHKVTPDDTLASVAHTYSVSVSALAACQSTRPDWQARWRRSARRARRPGRRPIAHTVYYTTRRGDTLVSVADRFGVSLTQLRRWNKLPATGIKIDAGRRLHVAEPTLVRASSSRSRHGKGKTGHARDRQHRPHDATPPAALHAKASTRSRNSSLWQVHVSKSAHTTHVNEASVALKSSRTHKNNRRAHFSSRVLIAFRSRCC